MNIQKRIELIMLGVFILLGLFILGEEIQFEILNLEQISSGVGRSFQAVEIWSEESQDPHVGVVLDAPAEWSLTTTRGQKVTVEGETGGYSFVVTRKGPDLVDPFNYDKTVVVVHSGKSMGFFTVKMDPEGGIADYVSYSLCSGDPAACLPPSPLNLY